MKLATLRSLLHHDLSRNADLLDRVTVVIVRLGQWASSKPAPVRAAWLLLDTLYLQLLLGVDIPPSVEIGPGLRLPHAGRGVILHPNVRIGARATLYHRVTIGANGELPVAPVLGDDVYVGANASILGALTVGDGAKVGAHALVLGDVRAGETAVGVPACSARGAAADADLRARRPAA